MNVRFFRRCAFGTLISQGPAPNQLHQWDIRFKMDRSSAVTMEELRQEILCRG